ncbi:MAG: aspartate aminotransferase family protein [Bacteroidales bacterium]
MNLFDVYPLWDIEPVKGKACYLWDKEGTRYLDFYGGHAVISIGHSHPHYLKRINEQLQQLGFYSNAVQNSLQKQLAKKLGELSGYPNYALFLCNSGAEANENAIKLASFHTGKKRVLAFSKAFHGRTSGAVATTDNPNIIAPFNESPNVCFTPFNQIEGIEEHLKTREFCAVIIEGIQGVAGIFEANNNFLQELRNLCTKYEVLLILDEIQSGYGRTGYFFAHQHANIQADIITTAKGMGNGFPIGGVIISPQIKPKHGMLGTTFGGNHLACAAALAVLEVFEQENLMNNASQMGEYLIQQLKNIKGVKELRGRGLIIGVEMENKVNELRNKLLFSDKIFTGAAGTNTIRLLPPLCINKQEIDTLINAMTL